MQSILIIGGYGKVGHTIASLLYKATRYHVTIGGRSPEKARAAAMAISDSITWIQLDIHDLPQCATVIDSFDAVVVCVDQSTTHFARMCLTKGKYYFDITANTRFLMDMQQLHTLAREHQGTALLSLGLCPGLSNLLVKELLCRHPDIESIYIGLLLGLGEKHGAAAIEWTLSNLAEDFSYNGIRVSSFKEARFFPFPSPFGERKAYRFNFSDQHTLQHSYSGKTFATYLCFDSPVTTWSLYWMKKTGLTNILRHSKRRKAAVDIFGKVSFGTDMYALSVYGTRSDAVVDSISLAGREEAHITAKFTSACIELLLNQAQKPWGIFDIQSVVSLADIWLKIKSSLTVYTNV